LITFFIHIYFIYINTYIIIVVNAIQTTK